MLDTTVLVDHLRSKGLDSTAVKLQEKAEVATTIINIFELYHGAYKSRDVKRNLVAVKGVRSTLRVLSFTEGSAEQAGRILAGLETKGQTIDARDLLIGAIALEEGFALLTKNLEHFGRIKDLQVVAEKQLLSQLNE